jgi:hypothetical protein
VTRGRLATAALGAVLAVGLLSAAAERPATGGLPTADEILAKYEQALGGRAALAKINTRTVWTRRIFDEGPPSENMLLRRSKRPGLSIMHSEALDGQFLAWSNGCDGTIGWTAGGRGAASNRIIDAPAGASAGPFCEQDLYYYGYLPLDRAYMKQSYQRLDVKGILKIVQPDVGIYGALAGGSGPDVVGPGPREAYLVAGYPVRPGDVMMWLYFDKDTGALLRRGHSLTKPSAAGDSAVVTDYLQYKAVGDGTRMPFQFVTHNASGRVRGVYLKVEDNTPIDDRVFIKPKTSEREDKGL